jgi:UDP-glucose 4-epimerase
MRLVENEAAFGQVLNIGGIEEVSIADLAKRIISACGSSSKIQFIPYDKAFGKDFEDMQRRVPGIDRVRELIGFDPQTRLDAILTKVISYMRKRTDSV